MIVKKWSPIITTKQQQQQTTYILFQSGENNCAILSENKENIAFLKGEQYLNWILIFKFCFMQLNKLENVTYLCEICKIILPVRMEKIIFKLAHWHAKAFLQLQN